MACPEHSTTDPATFVDDLIRAGLAVLVRPAGELELFARRSRLNRSGDGYSDVPSHPDAGALAARFSALSDQERGELAAHVLRRTRFA